MRPIASPHRALCARCWARMAFNVMRKMKIYLSEYLIQDKYERGNSYDSYIKQFVNFCENNEIELTRSNEFTNYDIIDSEIRESNALIAFVDEWWASSTWKMHEVFYAIGDYESMGKEKQKAVDVTVGLFYVDEVNYPVLKNIEGSVRVMTDMKEVENFAISEKYA